MTADVTNDLLDIVEQTHPSLRRHGFKPEINIDRLYRIADRAYHEIVRLQNDAHRRHLDEIRRFGT